MSSLSTSGVTVGRLDSFFVGLINDIMTVEQQPLETLKTQQDQINVRRGAYTDLSNRLSNLQSATWAIKNTSDTSLYLGNKTSISGVSTGSTVVTATASSDAIAGSYDISLLDPSGTLGLGLATAQRVGSAQQLYADQALGKTGSFYLGGAAARSHSSDDLKSGNNVTAFGVAAALGTGQTELGSDNYKVETREDPSNAGVYQFRLVNSDGKAVNIQQSTTGVYGSDWQAIPTDSKAYDTGRGLTLTFAASGFSTTSGTGAASTKYVAQGAKIDVTGTDSLNALASKINSGTYGEGNEVSASVVDRQLILTAKATGAAHSILAHDDGTGTVLKDLGIFDGASFTNPMQAAKDAKFLVNGLTVQRGSNANLTDVISGVSLSLASDAAGKVATINVATDTSVARGVLDTFMSSFNTLTTYLQDRMGVTAQTADGVTTYTRGSLNGESALGDLRQNMFSIFMNDASNSGTLTNLRQLGLSLDDNLQLKVSDSSKLETALTTNFANTQKLLDAVASKLDTQLSRFTGKTHGQTGLDSYLTAVQHSLDTENAEVGSSIVALTARLTERQQSLVNQFGEMQSQLYLLQYQQQQWQSIYSATA